MEDLERSLREKACLLQVKIIIILRKAVFNICKDNSELIVSEDSKKSTIILYTNFITYILMGNCNMGFTVELRANVFTETARPDDKVLNSQTLHIPPSLDQNLAEENTSNHMCHLHVSRFTLTRTTVCSGYQEGHEGMTSWQFLEAVFGSLVSWLLFLSLWCFPSS